MIREFTVQEKKHFLLKNESLSCLLRISGDKVELLHFGAPVGEEDAGALACTQGPGWGCSTMYGDICLDTLPLAWSESGTGDFRESPLTVLKGGVPVAPDCRFIEARCTKGIARLNGMPQAKGDCDTLEIVLAGGSVEVTLLFELFRTALTRRTVITNLTGDELCITKCMSSLLDLKGEFSMMTFDGGWIREAHGHSVPVSYSRCVNESLTGFSSNRHNPGFILCNESDSYGFNLVYSGNHYGSAQKSAQNLTRVMQGISPDSFSYVLKAHESFETPEAVMTWSGDGLDALRQRMHRFVNEHIVPSYWQYKERPVLFNNWEGCMFDFNERKLLSLAGKAKSIGCELFVLDDGWFGERNADTAGLGDYDVNRKKLPNGLKGLSEKIRALGLQFGLWFEPEAVNPDSKLYRAHPDWAIHTTEPDLLGRNELLLDLRKSEVRDYIVENVGRIIDEASLSYVKWDMNRHSPLLGAEAHAYILGLYDVLHRIFDARPQVLLESCASGGNRFDLGMLCFGPQAWASDDTDPVERLDIQEGLFHLYPQSTVGSHISASAHIQTLRATPLSTRENVSFFGAFGVELELSHLQPVEMKELRAAIAFYKQHRKTFQFGQLSALQAEENAVAWQVRGEDETIAAVFHTLVHAAQGYEWLKIPGLDRNSIYSVESRPQILRVSQFAGMVKYIAPIDPDPNGIFVRTADRYYKMEDAVFKAKCSGAAFEAGIPLNLKFTGTGYDKDFRNQGDFGSNVYVIKKEN